MAGKNINDYSNLDDIDISKPVRISAEQYKKMREKSQRSQTPQASPQVSSKQKYNEQQQKQLIFQKQQMQKLRTQQESFFITLTNQCANSINFIDIKIKTGKAQKSDIEKASSLLGSWSTSVLKKFEKEIPKLYSSKATSVFSQFADAVNKALPSQSLANDATYQEFLQNIRSQSARIVNDINVACLNACNVLESIATNALLIRALLNMRNSLKSLIQNIKSLPVGGSRENEIMRSPMYKKVFIEDFSTIQKFTQEIEEMSLSFKKMEKDENSQKALAGYRNELVKLANAMYVLNDDIHKLPHANPKANYITELANLYLAIIPEGIERYSYVKYVEYVDNILNDLDKLMDVCSKKYEQFMKTVLNGEVSGKLGKLISDLNIAFYNFLGAIGAVAGKESKIYKLELKIIRFKNLVSRSAFKLQTGKKTLQDYGLSIKDINGLAVSICDGDKFTKSFVKACDNLVDKGFSVLSKNLQQNIGNQDKKYFDNVIDLIKKVIACISKIKESSLIYPFKDELSQAYQELLKYFEDISGSLNNKK